MKIFLIGLPGSGKTTLGKQLAEKLGIDFLDIDIEIESQEGKTVREIFAEKGESFFREVESKVLKRLCVMQNDFVLATGGGTPCFFNNMDEMNQFGKTVFLDISIKEIVSRLSKTNLSERPLFNNLNPEQLQEKIQLLGKQRVDYYNKAQLKFSLEELSADDVLKKIKD